ncbi:hypothetical protein ANRL3_02780 [Anaerolineae bacterium]|nr:hypothetical protein ANRL3_02780 [Anaerolineae bacterium]
MAITYYKTVLGIAMQLFAMLLIVGIGKTFLFNYYNNIGEAFILKEYAVMLIVSVVLLVLSNKVPPMISGIITGSSIGNIGIGNFGAGAMTGAAAMAAAGVSMGGSMIGASASNAVGGASALMEAIKSAQKLESAGVGGSVGTPGGADGSGTPHGSGFSLASSVISELSKGTVSAAATQIKESSRDTLGGKIAAAIEANSKSTKSMDAESDNKPSFDGNSVGGAANTDSTFSSGDEVIDAFVNKNSS